MKNNNRMLSFFLDELLHFTIILMRRLTEAESAAFYFLKFSLC